MVFRIPSALHLHDLRASFEIAWPSSASTTLTERIVALDDAETITHAPSGLHAHRHALRVTASLRAGEDEVERVVVPLDRWRLWGRLVREGAAR